MNEPRVALANRHSGQSNVQSGLHGFIGGNGADNGPQQANRNDHSRQLLEYYQLRLVVCFIFKSLAIACTHKL